jgi:RNA polymerase sigma-70 factor (ECF subfamily)
MWQAAFEAGQQAWPTVNVDRSVFLERVTALGIDPEDLAARGSDLYLAVACGQNDAAAVGQFEEAFLKTVVRQIGRVALSTQQAEELKQQLRIKLLVGPTAKILEYRAGGPLGAWVRVCALRMALDMTRAPEMLRRNDSQALDALMASTPAGEALLDSTRHSEALRNALHDALTKLSPREKTILRLHFLEGMNIDALGDLFGVHRATVARWLVSIRGSLLDGVRGQLSLDIGASPSEAKSLVRLLDGEVHLSIQRLLEHQT